MKSFIIPASLQYAAFSNGIVYMIRLGKTLESLGFKVYFVVVESEYPQAEKLITTTLDQYLLDNASADPQTKEDARYRVEQARNTVKKYNLTLLEDFRQETIDNAYLIYAECIIDNPLNAPHVIRLFMNRDGYANGGKKANVGPHDFIMTHSKLMHPNPHYVLFFAELNPLFHSADTEMFLHRHIDVTFIGKGKKYGKCHALPGTIPITHDVPGTKEALAVLLRNTRYFFSWDSTSWINLEAVMCGAFLILMRCDPWTPEELDSTELSPLPKFLIQDSFSAGNMTIDISRLSQEVERIKEKIRFYQENWVPNVRTFVELVDRHFEKR